mmetsp:Transcript_11216/g.10824  ORF Transcript_11216/g.10824 Transcript_11216/m.10824 type:complete len:252 (-) Transcript_11216:1207-1962(-)
MSDNGFGTIDIAFNSSVVSLNDIRNSVLVGFGIFIFSLPFLRSRKSFFDIIAAKKVLRVVRYAVILEALWLLPLLFCVIEFGSPILIDPFTAYGDGNSWIYGFGRPCLGVVLIFFGIVAGMHPAPRIMCILGCAQAIVFDSFSALQVGDYFNQIQQHSAPPAGKYSKLELLYYYYRDVSSIAISSYLLMMTLFLSLILGCYQSLIPYQILDGGDLDRCEVMRRQMQIRRYIDDAEFQEEQEVTSKFIRIEE